MRNPPKSTIRERIATQKVAALVMRLAWLNIHRAFVDGDYFSIMHLSMYFPPGGGGVDNPGEIRDIWKVTVYFPPVGMKICV